MYSEIYGLTPRFRVCGRFNKRNNIESHKRMVFRSACVCACVFELTYLYTVHEMFRTDQSEEIVDCGGDKLIVRIKCTAIHK